MLKKIVTTVLIAILTSMLFSETIVELSNREKIHGEIVGKQGVRLFMLTNIDTKIEYVFFRISSIVSVKTDSIDVFSDTINSDDWFSSSYTDHTFSSYFDKSQEITHSKQLTNNLPTKQVTNKLPTQNQTLYIGLETMTDREFEIYKTQLMINEQKKSTALIVKAQDRTTIAIWAPTIIGLIILLIIVGNS